MEDVVVGEEVNLVLVDTHAAVLVGEEVVELPVTPVLGQLVLEFPHPAAGAGIDGMHLVVQWNVKQAVVIDGIGLQAGDAAEGDRPGHVEVLDVARIELGEDAMSSGMPVAMDVQPFFAGRPRQGIIPHRERLGTTDGEQEQGNHNEEPVHAREATTTHNLSLLTCHKGHCSECGKELSCSPCSRVEFRSQEIRSLLKYGNRVLAFSDSFLASMVRRHPVALPTVGGKGKPLSVGCQTK